MLAAVWDEEITETAESTICDGMELCRLIYSAYSVLLYLLL